MLEARSYRGLFRFEELGATRSYRELKGATGN